MLVKNTDSRWKNEKIHSEGKPQPEIITLYHYLARVDFEAPQINSSEDINHTKKWLLQGGYNDISFGGDGVNVFTENTQAEGDNTQIQINYQDLLIFAQDEEFGIHEEGMLRDNGLDEMDREILIEEERFEEIQPGVAKTDGLLKKLSMRKRTLLAYFTTDPKHHQDGLKSFGRLSKILDDIKKKTEINQGEDLENVGDHCS